MMLLLFSQLLPHQFFAAIGTSRLNETTAVWIANLDATAEKKVADCILSAISPNGTRVACNTTEKTSDTTHARYIAVSFSL